MSATIETQAAVPGEQDPQSLLALLRDNGIRVFADAGRLKTQNKPGAISPDLARMIKANKDALIEFLQLADAQSRQLGDITRVARAHPLALSFAQQRLWMIDRLDGGSPQYNIPMALRVTGALDADALERAIARIIQRHESLRTVFYESEGKPAQRVQQQFAFALRRHDLRRLTPQERQDRIEQLMRADRTKPFDLSADLMVRAAFVQLSDEAQCSDAEPLSAQRPAPQSLILFTMHHIAADGWSLGVLVNELLIQYKALLAGDPDPLPPLPVQYADYAHWQRQWLQGEVKTQQLTYWRKQLEGVPEVHSLPLDYRRPATKTYRGKWVVGHLESDLSARLQTLAREKRVTVFMLLHAALGLVLSRHSNNRDIVLGTPVANRRHAELDALIGFFVNTLVLRTSVEFESFPAYLDHVRQVNLDAQANQDIPFEMLVEHCGVKRTTQHTPLFQIMFAMNTNTVNTLDLPGVSFAPVDNSQAAAKFDLNISAEVTEAGLALRWIYDRSLFHRQRIEQLNGHLQCLLASIARTPDASLRELTMLPPEEVRYLLEDLNQTQINHGEPLLVHERFEAQVKRSPDALALVFGRQQLTYRQLNERANQLAHYLRAQGVSAQTLVGIYLSRSIEMIEAVLGILKAGGAYVPLDPSYPSARLASMLIECDVRLVLTQADLRANLAAGLAQKTGMPLIELDAPACRHQLQTFSCAGVGSPADVNAVAPADRLAYVMYTSGSTGQPKGVMVSHENLANYTAYAVRELMPAHVKAAVMSSSLAFDATAAALFPPLCCGRAIELLVDDKTPLTQLEQYLFHDTRSLLFKLTPTHLKAIGASAGAIANTLSKHVFIVGGEPLLETTLHRWQRELLPLAAFINQYGPTETTVGCTTFSVNEKMALAPDSAKMLPIGRAIDNTQLYVLDDHLDIVPFGAIGELYIGGAGVSLGYINRPELTRERFIENPFCVTPISHTTQASDVPRHGKSARLYRTGDRVRYLPDGELEFVGRVDDQVKIRGFRIEPGEIEQQLLAHEGVASASVLAREDDRGQKNLIAYVTLSTAAFSKDALLNIATLKSSTTQAWAARLKSHLRQTLPDYMVPAAIVILDQLPLTANGKLDKKALPTVEPSVSSAEYVAPTTETERLLVDLWAELLSLEVKCISTTGNFFELGGHSLLVFQLVSELQRRLTLVIPVKALFTHPTLKGLAAYIDRVAIETRQTQANEGPSASCLRTELRYGVISLAGEVISPALFIAPALGMTAVSYKTLAAHLDGALTPVLLTTPGIDEALPADTELLDYSLSERIEQWSLAIKAVQPGGHYRLMGHSFGGVVAFELACRLEASGHSVELVLIDAVLSRSVLSQPLSTLAELLLPSEAAADLNADAALYGKLIEWGLLPPVINREQFDGYIAAVNRQRDIFQLYQPQGKVAGNVTWVKATEGLGAFTTDKRTAVEDHIRSFCGGKFSTLSIEGSHRSVIDNNELVKKLMFSHETHAFSNV